MLSTTPEHPAAEQARYCATCGAPLSPSGVGGRRREGRILLVVACLLAVVIVALVALLVARVAGGRDEAEADSGATPGGPSASCPEPRPCPEPAASTAVVLQPAPTTPVSPTAPATATAVRPQGTTTTISTITTTGATSGRSPDEHCNAAIGAAMAKQCGVARAELAQCSGARRTTAVANVTKYCHAY